jgi:glutaredoxin 2
LPLTMPRYPLLGLPEFATAAAHDHYNVTLCETPLHSRVRLGTDTQIDDDVFNHRGRSFPGVALMVSAYA